MSYVPRLTAEQRQALSQAHLDRIRQQISDALLKQQEDWLLGTEASVGPDDVNPPLPTRSDLPAKPIRLTGAVLDILQTLAESNERLTRKRLCEAMKQAGRLRGESTLAGYLPKLQDDGLVDNLQDQDPVGYAITDKGRSALSLEKSRCL